MTTEQTRRADATAADSRGQHHRADTTAPAMPLLEQRRCPCHRPSRRRHASVRRARRPRHRPSRCRRPRHCRADTTALAAAQAARAIHCPCYGPTPEPCSPTPEPPSRSAAVRAHTAHEKAMEHVQTQLGYLETKLRPPKGRRTVTKPVATRGRRNSRFRKNPKVWVKKSDGLKGVRAGPLDLRVRRIRGHQNLATFHLFRFNYTK